MKKKVLIYQIGSIGDTIISLPTINAIVRHFGKNADFTLLHETNSNLLTSPKDVLNYELINEYLTYKNERSIIAKINILIILWWKIFSKSFDIVVYVLPCERNVLSVKRDKMFFKLCNIKKFIGFYSFTKSELYPKDNLGYPLKVNREALGRLLRIERDGIDISLEREFTPPLINIDYKINDKISKWISKNRKFSNIPLIAICPGAKQSANIWPISNFKKLGKLLLSNFKIEIIIIGSKDDNELASILLSYWQSGIDATGQFSVLESTAILEKCDLLIGLDTGTTHLAASVGTPCLTIFGERDNFGRWEPYGHDNVTVKAKVTCAGCGLSICNKEEHYCMNLISVDEVYNSAFKMITKITNEKYINN